MLALFERVGSNRPVVTVLEARLSSHGLLSVPEPLRPYVEARLMAVLAAAGPTIDVLPVVLDSLESGVAELRAAAARLAGRLGPAAAACLPSFLTILRPETGDTRVDLDHLLGLRGVGMTSPRLEVLVALGEMGVAADPALPWLEHYAQQPPSFVLPYETVARRSLERLLSESADPRG